MTQKIKLVLTDRGDSSVGMFPVYEEISVTFEYGGHDSEAMGIFAQELKRLVSECFGYGDGHAKVSAEIE